MLLSAIFRVKSARARDFTLTFTVGLKTDICWLFPLGCQLGIKCGLDKPADGFGSRGKAVLKPEVIDALEQLLFKQNIDVLFFRFIGHQQHYTVSRTAGIKS